MERYWTEIQKKICPKCIDGDRKGNCLLPVGETCPLKVYLSEIVTTIANTKSDAYAAYMNSLRRNVCIMCESQHADGTCSKRSDLECALDRYFPLVIMIVEDVKQRMAAAQAATQTS
ncbi:MAG TPA: hypothetical protein VIL52_07165 [Bacteroidota bacterium]